MPIAASPSPRRPIAPRALALLLLTTSVGAQETWTPNVPKTWDPTALEDFELPLARPEFSPRHIDPDHYAALPLRTVWRSYPVYHPDHEPEGYRDELRSKDPEPAFEPSDLHDQQDWIAAGRLVFHAPIDFDGPIFGPEQVLDPAWYEQFEVPTTTEGILPFARWVIREKGRLELGNLSCAMCHTRVLDDGTPVEGAQGNLPFEQLFAADIRRAAAPEPILRRVLGTLADVPWNDVQPSAKAPMTDLARQLEAIPPGVQLRQGTTLQAPARTPDLIGIADRRYLDATGFVRHRGIADLMRYAATNQGVDLLARYGDHVPATGTDQPPPPGEGWFTGTRDRYSDDQLYALALYIYSLTPPPNPHSLDDLARRGEQVFERESCTDCHPAPLYTSNQLVRAPGFRPPAEHFERYDVSRRRVDTDPELAMSTRRGTGYYKVPSLRGLWYRSPLGHSGSVKTLEEWFDPRRTDDDYVPSGFVPADPARRPVRGHRFGLDLSSDDKRALIAFLRTL